MAVMPKFTGLLALCLCATAAIASPLPAGPNVGSLDVHTPAAPLSDRRAETPAANTPALSSLGADNLGAASFLGARRVIDVEPLMDHSVNTNDGHSKREPKTDTVVDTVAPVISSDYHQYKDGKRAPKQDQIVGVEAPLGMGGASFHRYSDSKRDMGYPPPPPPPPGYAIPKPQLKTDLASVHIRQNGPPPPPPAEYTLPDPNLGLDIGRVVMRQDGMTIPATKGDVEVFHVNT